MSAFARFLTGLVAPLLLLTYPPAVSAIVGGEQVRDIDLYPFFALWGGCGGTVIHDDLILTAAHCVDQGETVWLYTTEREKGVSRKVAERSPHPKVVGDDSFDYDFQMLKTRASMLVDNNGNPTGVKAIELNKNSSVPKDYDPAWIVGFGLTQESGGAPSQVMMHAQVYDQPDMTCYSQWGSLYYQPDRMVCSGVEGGGVDVCNGDSGGPLVNSERQVLIGVVSFTFGCASAFSFGVEMRVDYEIDWIEEMRCTLSDFPPSSCPGSTNSGSDNNPGVSEGGTNDIDVNDTVSSITNITNHTDSIFCPLLTNHTYLEIYHNDSSIQDDGGSCSCFQKYDNFEVHCSLFYCMDCSTGICVQRSDIYEFGPKKDQAKVKNFTREFLFMYKEIPFVLTNNTGRVIDSGNWTRVKISSNHTSCSVMVVDNEDEETTMCSCEEFTCGNTTRFAYDCKGRKWGNCNSTLNNFDPEDMGTDDPLFVLNLEWKDCFDEQDS